MTKSFRAAWIGIVLMSASFSASAIPIFTDSSGREWLDINDTRGRTWTDVATVCDSSTGYCNGILAERPGSFAYDYDLTGFRWASADEVTSMLYDASGLPLGSLADGTETAAPQFGYNVFNSFIPTLSINMPGGPFEVINGLTRDLVMDNGSLKGVGWVATATATTSYFNQTTWPTDLPEISMGAFVYRQVPEPGTVALFAGGLLALYAVRRYRRRTLVPA